MKTSRTQEESVAESVETEEEVDPSIYIVQPGDTLAQIANELNVRIDDLITLNGIQDPDVHVGQELRIPGQEPTASSDGRCKSKTSRRKPDQQDEQEEEEDEDQIRAAERRAADGCRSGSDADAGLVHAVPPAGTRADDRHDSRSADQLPAIRRGGACPGCMGSTRLEPIIELFKAWPMPPLAVGNDRVVLVDTNANGEFSAAIVYTDPNSFGAAVPFSNLVVYDPVPGDPSKYRIAYDHALSYAREVQGIAAADRCRRLTGDAVRDLTFREITCDASRAA